MKQDYIALYRKYRPNLFKHLLDQKQIKYVLQNSIINQEFSHAYLFSGPRGTGKTSSAYIFAKAINCLSNIKGDACNKCKNCLLIINNQTFDIVEIDAAANNGVDNIRDLTDKISYNPINLKYKVYIIDEVHMLSKGAFNALLKTLEEPPKHVIFILATTEIKKIPITIISRTQKHTFKKIKLNNLASYLQKITIKENISVLEEDTLLNIAFLADGCVRDALSTLEQIAIYQDNKINNFGLFELFNYVTLEKQIKIINALISKDQKIILEIINYFHNKVIDYHFLMKSLILLLTNNLDKNHQSNSELKLNNLDDTLFLLKELIKFESLINKSKLPEITFQLLLLENLNLKKPTSIIKSSVEVDVSVIKPKQKLNNKDTISELKNNHQPKFNILECALNSESIKFQNLKISWSKIKSNILSQKFNQNALSLINAKPLWVYNDTLIIGFKEKIQVDSFNNNKSEFIKIINESLSEKFFIEAIDKNKWLTIKKQLKDKLLDKSINKADQIDKYKEEIFN